MDQGSGIGQGDPAGQTGVRLPTTGPYAICQNHSSVLPPGITVYEIQKVFLESLKQMRLLRTMAFIGRDYFIGLPSMHLVQPLLVLWLYIGGYE